MSEDQKQQLETQLWNIANTLRGKMNADEFRDYILGFVFYKYLSEKLHIFANTLLSQDGIDYEDVENHSSKEAYLEAIKRESLDSLGYFLMPSELFHAIATRGNSSGSEAFILGDLSRILNSIEQSTMGTKSEDDFDNLFEDLDLASTKLGRTETAKNELISKVLSHLDKIDFRLDDSKIDILGDAYEYLISKFAAGAGKKAGEFYTPQEVSTILARIVTTGKSRLKNVYDPTCGSGSLLLRVAREVDEVSEFVGQELNRTTYNLARMNMILHGVHYSKFNIQQDDTLENPMHVDQRFEAVVANPPFSAKWSAKQVFMSDDRFSQYGVLPPASKADFAFIEHMVYHLDDNGTMAVIMPHGVLYRSGVEETIRRYIVENKNYLDAVIGLPQNIFFGTGIPTCILVLKKCRKFDDDILFIDASREFEKIGKRNKLGTEHVDKISQTFQKRMAVDKYSSRVKAKEIAENGFNLNIRRYIDNFEEEKRINLDEVIRQLKDIDHKVQSPDLAIEKYEKTSYLEAKQQLLFDYKKAVSQTIFNQEAELVDENGKRYASWSNLELSSLLKNRREKNPKNLELLSVSISDGVRLASSSDRDLNTSADTTNYLKVHKGDLVYNSMRMWQGSSGVSRYEGFVSPAYTVLAPNKQVDTTFFGYYFKTPRLIYLFYKYSQGMTSDTWSLKYPNFSEIKADVPTYEEQTKIARILVTIDEKIRFQAESFTEYEEWKEF